MNYSDRMKAYMAENGIDAKSVVYLTIAREPLERIISGDKTVEFRDLSDHYLKKLFKVEGDAVVDVKPFTHVLFQAGYSATSPRALVEFQDAGAKEESQKAPVSPMGKRMFAEAEVEGFTVDDEWVAIALGKVCVVENF
nr:MAG TPA: Sulfotransferase family [Caudoviricetes sp.]